MKLIIRNAITKQPFFGYGNTLLACIYDLSNVEIKGSIFVELDKKYDGNELIKYDIEDVLYRWCNRNNYQYYVSN